MDMYHDPIKYPNFLVDIQNKNFCLVSFHSNSHYYVMNYIFGSILG